MVHQNMRFDPAIRTAHMLLAKGVIGDIFAVKSSLTHKGPQAWSEKANWFFDKKKSGGGALMDLGPHVFDTLSFLLDDEAVLVGAVVAARWPQGEAERRHGAGSNRCSCFLFTPV